MRLIIGVKNPTEELTGIYFFTLVVGYFACARYEVSRFTNKKAAGRGNPPCRIK